MNTNWGNGWQVRLFIRKNVLCNVTRCPLETESLASGLLNIVGLAWFITVFREYSSTLSILPVHPIKPSGPGSKTGWFQLSTQILYKHPPRRNPIQVAEVEKRKTHHWFNREKLKLNHSNRDGHVTWPVTSHPWRHVVLHRCRFSRWWGKRILKIAEHQVETFLRDPRQIRDPSA